MLPKMSCGVTKMLFGQQKKNSYPKSRSVLPKMSFGATQNVVRPKKNQKKNVKEVKKKKKIFKIIYIKGRDSMIKKKIISHHHFKVEI